MFGFDMDCACRHLEALRTLAEVLHESMMAFLAVTLLVLLFLTVFTTWGLHLFGEYELDITYPSFDTFMESFLTVFQVRSPFRCERKEVILIMALPRAC